MKRRRDGEGDAMDAYSAKSTVGEDNPRTARSLRDGTESKHIGEGGREARRNSSDDLKGGGKKNSSASLWPDKVSG